MSKTHFIVPFFIPHIGCPHHCVFCSQGKITGKERPVTPEEVIPTIREYRTTIPRNARMVEAAFFGGSFTGIPVPLQRAFLKEAYLAKKEGLIDGIRLSTRPDYIDQEVLERLAEFHVDTVELGVQSMSDEVLIKSGRGHTSADVVQASRKIREYGFRLGLQMMIGLPGSRPDTEVQTASRICALKPDFVRIYPTLVIRGTALETMYKKGMYKPPSLEEAVDLCAVLAAMFIRENIAIIRIGLQPTELINEGGEVVAGPFHPSFRQLVDSRLVLKAVKWILNQRGIELEEGLVMEVSPRSLSTLMGIGKKNIKALEREYPGLEVKVLKKKKLGRSEIRFTNGKRVFEADYRQVIKSIK
jgi:radical SAM enzyme (TIGR01210 family)